MMNQMLSSNLALNWSAAGSVLAAGNNKARRDPPSESRISKKMRCSGTFDTSRVVCLNSSLLAREETWFMGVVRPVPCSSFASSGGCTIPPEKSSFADRFESIDVPTVHDRRRLALESGWYQPNRWVVTKKHFVPSDLNGANGEATGSDDVDHIALAKQNNHSAQLRLHQKATSQERADPDDHTERQPGKPARADAAPPANAKPSTHGFASGPAEQYPKPPTPKQLRAIAAKEAKDLAVQMTPLGGISGAWIGLYGRHRSSPQYLHRVTKRLVRDQSVKGSETRVYGCDSLFSLEHQVVYDLDRDFVVDECCELDSMLLPDPIIIPEYTAFMARTALARAKRDHAKAVRLYKLIPQDDETTVHHATLPMPVPDEVWRLTTLCDSLAPKPTPSSCHDGDTGAEVICAAVNKTVQVKIFLKVEASLIERNTFVERIEYAQASVDAPNMANFPLAQFAGALVVGGLSWYYSTAKKDVSEWLNPTGSRIFPITGLINTGDVNAFEYNAMAHHGYNAYRLAEVSTTALRWLTSEKMGKPSSFTQQQYADCALKKFSADVQSSTLIDTATHHHQNLLAVHYNFGLQSGLKKEGIESL